jgi:4a-hydroxytetrahydrobiopterin dehydratase
MAAKKQFTKKEIEKHLKDLSGWKVNPKNTTLTKSFDFPTFISGLAFAAKITVHAEVLEHHPEITLTYGSVKISLTTHDVKGLTKKDFELAGRIDNLKV